MSDKNENFVTIHAKIDGVEVAQTIELAYGKGNPRFNASAVAAGIKEAAEEINTMLVARFGDRPITLP